MVNITTRKDFEDACLRKLGHPVVQVRVTPEQLRDRVDEALKLFRDYHFDATFQTYYKYQVTAQDKLNKYITLPDDIISVEKVLPMSGVNTGNYMFDLRYQTTVNEIYSLSSATLTPYVVAMQHLKLLDEIMVGEKLVRFNKMDGKLHIDMDWNRINVDEYLMIRCVQIVPESNTKIWNDRWLQNYASALIKIQWGNNLSTFSNIPLPNGQTFNAIGIKEAGEKDKYELEEELKDSYSQYTQFYMG